MELIATGRDSKLLASATYEEDVRIARDNYNEKWDEYEQRFYYCQPKITTLCIRRFYIGFLLNMEGFHTPLGIILYVEDGKKTWYEKQGDMIDEVVSRIKVRLQDLTENRSSATIMATTVNKLDEFESVLHLLTKKRKR